MVREAARLEVRVAMAVLSGENNLELSSGSSDNDQHLKAGVGEACDKQFAGNKASAADDSQR